MITEDYCSYEVSKLLEEKEFPILEFYKGAIGVFNGVAVSNITKELIKERILSCIPHSVVMKWLREVHNLHIVIYHYPTKFNYSDKKLWYCEIVTLTSPESIDK